MHMSLSKLCEIVKDRGACKKVGRHLVIEQQQQH